MNLPKWIEPSRSEIQSYEDPDYFPSLHFWGHTFSPKKFTELTGIACTEANEPNEIGVAGDYMGKESPYGAAIIRPPKEMTTGQRLCWIAEIAGCLTHKFRKEHGITFETLYLTVRYRGLCRMLFPGEVLRTIGFPAVAMIITCVPDELEDFVRLN